MASESNFSYRQFLRATAGGVAFVVAGVLLGAQMISDGAASPSQPKLDPGTAMAGSETGKAASTAPMASMSQMSDAEFQKRVESALLADPGFFQKWTDALKAKQQAEQAERSSKAITDNDAALFHDADDLVLGDPNGDVTVIEFYDNRCPYCHLLAPDLNLLLQNDPHIRLVLKEWPILPPPSEAAAKAALASRYQDKYVAFHEKLMTTATPENQWTDDLVNKIAADAGLDSDKLKADMERPEIASKIAANRALASKLGLHGTPALVIGKHLYGGGPYQSLAGWVAQERAAQTTAAPTANAKKL